MVRFNLTINGSERTMRQVAEALRTLAVSTRLEAECLGCRVWLDDDGDTNFAHHEEVWASEIDMRRRIRSDQFTSVLALMERSREAPDVQFDFVTTTRGLEYVAEVRQLESGGDRS